MLSRKERFGRPILVIQFETGEIPLLESGASIDVLRFAPGRLMDSPEDVRNDIRDKLLACAYDEVWMEWNGMTPFADLYHLVLHRHLRFLMKLVRVIHLGDAERIEMLLADTGDILSGQLAQSDVLLLRNAPSGKALRMLIRNLRRHRRGLEILGASQRDALQKHLAERFVKPVGSFFFLLLLFLVLLPMMEPLFSWLHIPFGEMVMIVISVLLQAFPFLLVGVLLSSAIQVFVPTAWVARHFPKSTGLGMMTAVLGGFMLPVCDCASIPVFRSLLRKGVPLPAAVTFMAASPVINPVVILSTYHAFGGSPIAAATRVLFGLLAAVLVGLRYVVFPAESVLQETGCQGGDACGCGCLMAGGTEAPPQGKLMQFLLHAQGEFLDVGKYLLLGAALSAVFQTVLPLNPSGINTRWGAAASVLLMMLLAFFLSLCSSSDAIIARSYGNMLPMAALMGFMVFGPMMDLKNLLMLGSGFSRRFVIGLLLTTFVACFLVVVLITGGGLP